MEHIPHTHLATPVAVFTCMAWDHRTTECIFYIYGLVHTNYALSLDVETLVHGIPFMPCMYLSNWLLVGEIKVRRVGPRPGWNAHQVPSGDKCSSLAAWEWGWICTWTLLNESFLTGFVVGELEWGHLLGNHTSRLDTRFQPMGLLHQLLLHGYYTSTIYNCWAP